MCKDIWDFAHLLPVCLLVFQQPTCQQWKACIHLFSYSASFGVLIEISSHLISLYGSFEVIHIFFASALTTAFSLVVTDLFLVFNPNVFLVKQNVFHWFHWKPIKDKIAHLWMAFRIWPWRWLYEVFTYRVLFLGVSGTMCVTVHTHWLHIHYFVEGHEN